MRKIFYLFIAVLFWGSCIQETFMESVDVGGAPTGLKYMSIVNAREVKTIISNTPTINTNGLVPYYEVVTGYDGNGLELDASFLDFVTISNPDTIPWELKDKEEYPLDENGDTIKGGITFDTSKAGVISINEGHPFTVGDYYISVKVTTQKGDERFVSIFDKAFHVHIEPLLPPYLIYQLKNQNLVAGDLNSRTKAPIIPVGNKDVRFGLLTDTDKLSIDSVSGVVTLAPNYLYGQYDTIRPTIEVISNISKEKVQFCNSLVVIVTDTPKQMPVESIYFFYPSLKTSGAKPTGGDGFSVQTLNPGISQRLWGVRTNSAGGALLRPDTRPENTDMQILETLTHSSAGKTQPVASWCVMATQDLSLYNIGYDLSFSYLYMPAFQNYMSDGRTPTDLEVYISTNYTGGPLQNPDGTWTGNGTWKKINRNINCCISKGTTGSNSNGTNWTENFIGTPYPGDQKGDDPDGFKDLNRGSVYNKWIKCDYDITQYKNSKTFTIAFKVASYFTGELLNNVSAPGRGGIYFLSDFHYVAKEQLPEE